MSQTTMEAKQYHEIDIKFLDEENIGVYELQYFLKNFNILYLIILDLVTRLEIMNSDYTSKEEIDRYIEIMKKHMMYVDRVKYRIYSNQLNTQENDLAIYRLSKNSPLDIGFVGEMISMLTIIVVILGGEYEVDILKLKFKVKVNKSLGEAIQDLKKAFRF